MLLQLFVHSVKHYAVMDVPRGNFYSKHEVVTVTDRVRAIGKAFLVLTFVKQTALRVCCGNRDRPCFRLFPGWSVVKRFFPMLRSVRIHFCQ